MVSVSPDVASSTNQGGWINKVGVWSPQDRHDWFATDPATEGDRLVRWRETRSIPIAGGFSTFLPCRNMP